MDPVHATDDRSNQTGIHIASQESILAAGVGLGAPDDGKGMIAGDGAVEPSYGPQEMRLARNEIFFTLQHMLLAKLS